MMMNSSTVIEEWNNFVIGAPLMRELRLVDMKRKPLSDADREAAKNLRRLWDEKKTVLSLTQDKAAERLGFSTQGAVSHYLNGYTPLNTDAVLKFAALLQVSPIEIRPDIQDLLSSAMDTQRANGLSDIANGFIGWLIEQATMGRLTDSDLLVLRGRAEQVIEGHSSQSSSGIHEWIAGGKTKLPHGPRWKGGKGG